MASYSILPLLDIWQDQIHDSTTCWQEIFKVQEKSVDALTQWQSCMDQSYTEWSSLWQQWQSALRQWLTNWSDISGYTLQSNPSLGMLFPPLGDLSRLNQAVIQLMEQSHESMLTEFGALVADRTAELTAHVTQLATAITSINQHLEMIIARLETSDTFVTEQVQALRDQMQTAYAATTQQLTALTQRLDEGLISPTRSSTRSATRPKP
jgi:hypothetical protein